jgi:membrane-associated phospholipid phosphatase
MNPSTDPPSAPVPAPWKSELWFRIRTLFLLKFVGTSVFTWLFFIGYFHLLRFPASEVTTMPLTALDHLIPFQPQWLFAYLTLWFYVGVAPGLQRNFAELVVYGLWVGALCLTGLALFYLWPTAIPPMTLDVSGHPGFAMLQGVDASGNACPSMHVAVAIFTAVRLDDVWRQMRTPLAFRWANALWFLAIAWSTLAVKQHVALDALAGALLGLAFVLPSLRWRPAPYSAPLVAGRADIISYQ